MKKLLLFFMLQISLLSFAQPGSMDTSFNPTDLGFGIGEGADSIINSTAIQSDGKIIIGGAFLSFNGTAINRIARLNADGSLDTSFNPGTGASNTVTTIAIQSDGKIIIGGAFTSFNGTAIRRIARLNADGSLDTTFSTGTGPSSTVNTIAIQSDGKIIIGGLFTSFNGTAASRIARLNTNGSLDTSFNVGTGTDTTVWSTAIQTDGKIIIGGSFTSFNGTTRNRIARLNSNGSLDTTFNPGSGADNIINFITIQPDAKIIIGGDFTTFNGTARNKISRLLTNGSLDTTFNPVTGANGTVVSIAIQSDGKLIIAGQFTTVNGIARNYIARLLTDGSLDTTFNPGSGADNYIYSIAIQSDGKTTIVGSFATFNGTPKNYIARLLMDGSLDTSFNPSTGGANYTVRSTLILPDGKIIIGGSFTSFNGIIKNRIARLQEDGSLDTSFNIGTAANGSIYSTVIQSDGKIIIGGAFLTFNGIGRNRIARLNVDGSLDTTFNPGTGANSTVLSIAIQSDGKIVIAGDFTTVNGTSRNSIARLHPDGSLDTTFTPGTGANSTVISTAIQSDGKIIIAGQFTTVNGIARNYIARLNSDGSLDTSFNPGTGANAPVLSASIQPDGKIIIGGSFTSFNGIIINSIARLHLDGSLDTSFNIGTGANGNIYSTAIQYDGKIIIGGAFLTFNGIARNRMALLNTDGSLDTSFDPGTGANSTVRSFAIQSDGKIIIGGDFISYNGIGRNKVARVNRSIFQPTVPTVSASSTSNCGTVATTLNIVSGSLNDATNWQWYSGSCEGTSVGSGTSISVSPTITTTYYARGEGGGTTPGSCGSITITVTAPTANGNVTTSICQGQTYVWPANGQSYTTAQTNLQYVLGCNTATLNLTVNPLTTNGNVTTSICQGQTYVWPANGQSYTTAQTNLQYVSGCNTATLNLTVNPLTTNGNVTTSICQGETYVWPANGQSYTTAQTNLQYVSGCNTATLNLTVNPLPTVTATNVTGCPNTNIALIGSPLGGTFSITNPYNGTVNTTYTYSYTDGNGCSNTSSLATVTINTEINFNNIDDNCDGSKFEGHAPVVVNITTPTGSLTQGSIINATTATNTSPYSGAPGVTYKFKVTKTNAPTSEVFVTSNTPSFTFSSASNAANASTYDIQATAIVNGEEQPYNGNTTSYSTPAAPTLPNPPTVSGPLVGPCAYTIARIDSYIYANNSITYGANRYEFLVERMNNGNPVQTLSVTTTVPYFKLTNIAGIPATMQVTYGTTYRISVRYGYGATSFGSQIYTAYGAPCLVSTPALPVASVPCGVTLASVNAYIYASGYAAGANQFEYLVTRVSAPQPGELPLPIGPPPSETLPRNVPNFKLTMLTSLFVGLQKEYSVSVRYRVSSYGMDHYSAWSEACPLYTPNFPETQIVAGQCGVEGVPSTVNQYLYADFVPGATQYRFRLYNAVDLPYTESSPYNYSVYSPNNYVKLNQFPGLQAGVAYSIVVIPQMYGEYPDIALAKDCSVTAPESTPVGPTKAVVASPFQATAYPNPFANNFMINVKSSSQSVVNLKVYDMIGRLIEQRETTVSDLETATIGNRYPSGVYNVVVSQDDNVEAVRVVKR